MNPLENLSSSVLSVVVSSWGNNISKVEIKTSPCGQIPVGRILHTTPLCHWRCIFFLHRDISCAKRRTWTPASPRARASSPRRRSGTPPVRTLPHTAGAPVLTAAQERDAPGAHPASHGGGPRPQGADTPNVDGAVPRSGQGRPVQSTECVHCIFNEYRHTGCRTGWMGQLLTF